MYLTFKAVLFRYLPVTFEKELRKGYHDNVCLTCNTYYPYTHTYNTTQNTTFVHVHHLPQFIPGKKSTKFWKFNVEHGLFFL